MFNSDAPSGDSVCPLEYLDLEFLIQATLALKTRILSFACECYDLRALAFMGSQKLSW